MKAWHAVYQAISQLPRPGKLGELRRNKGNWGKLGEPRSQRAGELKLADRQLASQRTGCT